MFGMISELTLKEFDNLSPLLMLSAARTGHPTAILRPTAASIAHSFRELCTQN
jgi:hypothetical protein